MEKSLTNQILDVCKVLNKNTVQPYDNYFKLLNTLEELGQDITEFREEQSPNPLKSYFRLN